MSLFTSGGSLLIGGLPSFYFLCTMKILLIDDDRTSLIYYERVILSNWKQCITTKFRDAENALYEMKHTKFDLVLCDLKLPGIDGFQFKKRLNSLNDWTPVVFISGYDPVDKIRIVRQLGAFTLLRKPVDSKVLIDTLSNCLKAASIATIKPDYLDPVAKLNIVGGTIYEKLLSTNCSIGRDSTCDIRLDSARVSRQHGIFTRNFDSTKESHYTLVDYSQNGILVNGKRISNYQELHHGDVILVPSVEITYTELDRGTKRNDSTYTGEEETNG